MLVLHYAVWVCQNYVHVMPVTLCFFLFYCQNYVHVMPVLRYAVWVYCQNYRVTQKIGTSEKLNKN